jgi:hypothetical protein
VIHPRHNASDDAIRTAIAIVASELSPTGDSGWRFTLLNGAPHVVTAKTDGAWLLLEADCSGEAQRPEGFWDALVRNASFAGLAKLVLAHDGSPRLRAELPVQEGVELTARVRETCRGFETAWSHKDDHSSPAASPAVDAEPVDLNRLCSEAGWPFAERGSQKLAFELEVRGGFCQALLVSTERGVRISCEIATLDAIPAECRQAVGGLLLAASGLVRMGRGSVNANRTPPVAQFEVVFGTAPSPSEISSTLESLSVGCSLCGEEVKTLQVPAIAERYLALRGWGANPASRQNERTVTP